MISSSKNEKIKKLIRLLDSKVNKNSGLYLAEGFTMLEEAVRSDAHVEEVYVAEEFLSDYLSRFDFSHYVVDSRVMKSISKTVSGKELVFLVRKKEPVAVDDILCERLLYLENISDPGNMGTIIRTADAFSFNHILLSEGCVNVYGEKVVRSSMGSVFRTDFSYVNYEQIMSLKGRGYSIIATSPVKTNSLVRTDKFILALGNEAAGLDKKILENCDYTLNIPMSGITESLNVGIAAGISMYILREEQRC